MIVHVSRNHFPIGRRTADSKGIARGWADRRPTEAGRDLIHMAPVDVDYLSTTTLTMSGPLYAPPILRLYPFLFRDPVSGKWVRARYVTEREVIAARYREWESPARRNCAGRSAQRSVHRG